MLLQSALEVLILILLVAVLWRTRGRSDLPPAKPETTNNLSLPPVPPSLLPDDVKASLERFLTESEKLAKTFEGNLKDKKELTTDLILKLDRRLNEYKEILNKTEQAVKTGQERLAQLKQDGQTLINPDPNLTQANPAAPEVRALVLQLAKKGLSVEEIAVRSKLHRGEVELIIDLDNQFEV
jgi:hypothetical protein